MEKKVLLLFPLILFSLASFGQFFYTDHSTVDSVEISYKWKDVKEGPKELRLKFKNKNNHAVLINLNVDYYMSGILEESSSVTDFCLSSRSMVAGKLDGVIVTASELSNEDLGSEDFEFKINDIEVEQTDECEENDVEDDAENPQNR